MSSLDLMKAGIGLAVVIGIALTAVAGYVLFMALGSIDGLTVALEPFVSVLFSGLIVVAAASVRRVVPRPCIRV